MKKTTLKWNWESKKKISKNIINTSRFPQTIKTQNTNRTISCKDFKFKKNKATPLKRKGSRIDREISRKWTQHFD